MPKGFLLSSTGQIDSAFYPYDMLLWPVCYNQTDARFHSGGVAWVTVDFDSQYKIVWAETKAHGYRYQFR